MIDENAFYIELYRKSQTLLLGVNRPLVLSRIRIVKIMESKSA